MAGGARVRGRGSRVVRTSTAGCPLHSEAAAEPEEEVAERSHRQGRRGRRGLDAAAAGRALLPTSGRGPRRVRGRRLSRRRVLLQARERHGPAPRRLHVVPPKSGGGAGLWGGPGATRIVAFACLFLAILFCLCLCFGDAYLLSTLQLAFPSPKDTAPAELRALYTSEYHIGTLHPLNIPHNQSMLRECLCTFP